MSQERVLQLLDELDRERSAFTDAIRALPFAAEARPIVETWTAADLAWHCGFWAEHGAEALELVASGRQEEFRYDSSETDAMNASEAEVGRRQDAAAIRMREEAAYARLRRALSQLSDDELDVRLGNGDTAEDVVRYDGPDHYAEHTAQLRKPLG